jgi:hypothetical protein
VRRLLASLDDLAGLLGLGPQWNEQPSLLPYTLNGIVRRAAKSYDLQSRLSEDSHAEDQKRIWEQQASIIETAAHALRCSYLDFSEKLFVACRPGVDTRHVSLNELRVRKIDLAAFAPLSESACR